MIKKALAGFVTAASMLCPNFFITASPASADDLYQTCFFNLKAPDNTILYNAVEVLVYYRISSSGHSVYPTGIQVFNYAGRSITVTENRWQNKDRTIVYRGTGGQIPSNYYGYPGVPWNPPNESKAWIPRNQTPVVTVAAQATTRPGLHGSISCNVPY